MLRVVQEALTNVRKHSSATQVEVKFESRHNSIKMIIKDNGRGFVIGGVNRRHGLSVMKERVQSLGGSLDINTAPGKGTEIQVTVPMHSRIGDIVG